MENTFYKDAMFALTDGVYVVDMARKILFWNKAAERLTGYSSAEVLGRQCADNMLCHVDAKGRELCARTCPLNSTIRDGKLVTFAAFLHHKNGQRVPVAIKASPLKDEVGNVIGAVEFFSLAIPRKSFVTEFEKARINALRDRLTGLGNRRLGETTLANLHYQSKNDDASYGVLLVDVDHLKHVNEMWGHAVGDEVLRMVANSLNSNVRMFDAISRWGAEEFLLIFSNSNSQELLTVGERLRLLVEKSRFEHEGTTIKVTGSFGGVIAKNDEEVHSVLQRTNKQMYLSKSNGRNIVSIDS